MAEWDKKTTLVDKVFCLNFMGLLGLTKEMSGNNRLIGEKDLTWNLSRTTLALQQEPDKAW